ncbi:MAG: pilus assembly protein N-terminal domain-containing protein [Hyphomicrobiaceae bacterium]|nr:pilus assembly protein N-terminal domain-containing protein [Hyphomicrobiaceae bacterium]MCC0022700.1 pilus assembly protein N-terminal domain-containing protein [Hyphomicrobiaceae bacterium]
MSHRVANPGFLRRFTALCLAGAVCIASAGVAAASDGAVSVSVNMARILRISSPASTVVIGNPGIADVTIQDAQTLILTGKSYGTTNLIVLDPVGNPIVDTMIDVARGESELITVFQGQAKTTMACEPDCQPVIMLGDDTNYTAKAIASSSLVESSAK